MIIVNEKYKLNKEWLDLLLEHKNNENVTFNLSNNDIRILLTYIEVLQQENAQLKDKIEKTIQFYTFELLKRENLQKPMKMSWESVEMFNILDGNRFFLIVIACVTLLLIYYFLKQEPAGNQLEIVGYGLFIGGILGNLCDRLFRGFVIDYLDFQLFNIHMPIFNFADICICFGVFLCVLSLAKGELGWKK